MAGEFSIRPVQDGDEADIYRLLTLNGPSEIPEDDFRHHANEARRLVEAGHDRGGGWLAIADGRAVGLITSKDFSGGVVVERDYSSAGDKGYKGIGAALVRAREEFLVARGETEARADIRATNAPSLRMFTKLGYAFDEASRGALAKWQAAPDEEPTPVLVLTKRLGRPNGPG
jgi:hypothetical protein